MAIFEAKPYSHAHSVPIAELYSRVARSHLRAATRPDAFWDTSAPGWAPRWLSRSEAEKLAAQGRRLRRWCDLSVSKDEALASLWERRRGAPRFIRLRLFSAIHHWRVLSTEQAAAFVGVRGIDEDLLALWQSGLVSRGTPVPQSWDGNAPDVELWRISPDATVRSLLREMTPWERIGVLGGAKWVPRAPYTRHDLLVADATLRVAEFVASIGAVYGEPLSGARLLTGLPVTTTRGAKGDVVWVRSDGLRIVVELTRMQGNDEVRKVEHWGRVLVEERPRRTFVLFLIAANPLHNMSQLRWLNKLYSNALAKYAHADLSAISARIEERMGVALLSDWFPEPMSASLDLPRLPVWRPTGPPSDRFELADLADPDQVACEPGEDALAPVWHAPLVYAQPWWLAAEATPLARSHLPRWTTLTMG